MANERIEKAALTIVWIVVAVLVSLIAIGGWAVIELINWITSK